MTEQLHAYVDQLAKALELAGVAIIVGGILLATWWFIRDGSRTGDWQSAYPNYRSNIGRGILLGLELLVDALGGRCEVLAEKPAASAGLIRMG